MDYLQTGVYVPVPIVHAGSKSMVYVCESACFTCVHLARDDIAVGENGYISLYSNGKERSEILLKHRCYVACPFVSHRIGAEALGNSQRLLYQWNLALQGRRWRTYLLM